MLFPVKHVNGYDDTQYLSLIHIYIDTLGNDLFVACLDAGHALLTYDSPARMAKVLGSRLKVLHVHDVDGIDDLHTVPYLGNNDWPEFCQALKEIGYKGTFNFETLSLIHI